jgi:transcription termination factor Rho
MSIDVRPGGCWCEGLPDGGFVEHMRVVHARPRQMLRMVGALGPLQKVSVNGAMEFVLDKMNQTKNNLDFFYMMRRGG